MTTMFRPIAAFLILVLSILALTGCSPGRQNLMTITPQQYFYSAKERLETIDERNYDVKDLDEIIRILENAEKDAKRAEIIDKSRLYLALVHVLKARKQYFSNVMKGHYLANRPEPFFALDVKPVRETLRAARKWLRLTKAQIKTARIVPDLYFVEGLYYSHKMLTQRGSEARESLWTAVRAFRTCLGRAPDFKSDVRLFGREQTPRDVRLRLIEALALGGEPAEAYGLLSEYEFSPLTPVAGSRTRFDYPWHHMKGLVLALMGQYEAAAEVLQPFKIIPPQDYPVVEDALWILEGVYDRLRDVTGDDRYVMEARIVGSLLKRWKGRYSKERYTTAAHLFPRHQAGDLTYFEAVLAFYKGRFDQAIATLRTIRGHGLMSTSHRSASRLLALESKLYSGQQLTDDAIEDMVALSRDRNLSPWHRERLAFLMARYVMEQDTGFTSGKREGEGHAFIHSITSQPWALELTFSRGKLVEPDRPLTQRWRSPSVAAAEAPVEPPKREPSTLLAEVYANRPDDWVIAGNLHLISLPEFSLVGEGRIVGREKEGKGWAFKGEEVDELRRGRTYLAVLEYDNSDGKRNLQGILFSP